MYREGSTVYFQNHFLQFDKLATPFRIERPWESVRPRRIITDEGHRPSEWSLPVTDLKAWLDSEVKSSGHGEEAG